MDYAKTLAHPPEMSTPQRELALAEHPEAAARTHPDDAPTLRTQASNSLVDLP